MDANLHKQSDIPTPTKITSWFNLAALAEYQYGNHDAAEQLCSAAVNLCLEYFDHTRDCAWISALLQPCANIGRLRWIRGQTEDALLRFRSIFLFIRGDYDLQINGRSISVGVCQDIQNCDRNIVRTFTNSYAADSVRACLLNEEYPRLQRFLRQCREDGVEKTYAIRYLVEGELRYSLSVGELRSALDKAIELWSLCKKDLNPDPSVLGLLCDVYLTAGRQDLASSVAEKMTAYCDQLAESGRCNRVLKRALYVLALRCISCGDLQAAVSSASRSFALSRSLGDEATCVRMACIVCDLHSEASLTDFGRQDGTLLTLWRLATTTLYRVEQLLAYLELDTHQFIPEGNAVTRAYYSSQVQQLTGKLGPVDAKTVRQLYPHHFVCAGANQNSSTPNRINTCPAIERVYEGLMGYANRVICS
ncbi:MAG TPA: hypothetical protein VGX94_06180 [Terriglobia bacterium]|nr:hypothetical protein [Terriglobia bacterium]